MGKKKAESKKPSKEEGGAAPDKDAEEAEADPPIVVELKRIDDNYLEIEREYEKEIQALQRKYVERQAPLLEERKALLRNGLPGDASEKGDAKTGTPALKGFWLQAMQNHPHLGESIEEWDEPVLEFLTDITKDYLDPEDSQKGFKLAFHFIENPYFTNSEITKEYHTQERSPYTGEMDTEEVKASEINWKPGKNVTVEAVKKKVKGGGAKKQKAKSKEKEEPRDSFFRGFFRNLKVGEAIPDDVNMEEARAMLEQDSDEEDEEEMLELLMEHDYEMGLLFRDSIVPFAVRFYTGEAAPDDDDDDDEGDEEEEDDDDDEEEEEDDDDDEDESPPPPKKKGAAKKKGGGGGGGDEKKGAGGGGEQKQQEECKQQ